MIVSVALRCGKGLGRCVKGGVMACTLSAQRIAGKGRYSRAKEESKIIATRGGKREQCKAGGMENIGVDTTARSPAWNNADRSANEVRRDWRSGQHDASVGGCYWKAAVFLGVPHRRQAGRMDVSYGPSIAGQELTEVRTIRRF